ncbi:gas vesicle protein GvpG [Nocardia sp. X0981]
MGLLWSIVSLPWAPVRGVIWVSEVIQEQVEQQLRNPASVRRELEQIEADAAAGRITEEERDRAQQEVLDRMIRPPGM